MKDKEARCRPQLKEAPEEKFQRIFGASPDVANPHTILSVILQKYDAVKWLHKASIDARLHPEAEELYLGEGGREKFDEREERLQRDLLKAFWAARPFIAEDLTFLIEHATFPHGATSDYLLNNTGMGLTPSQRQVLRGQVTLRKS